MLQSSAGQQDPVIRTYMLSNSNVKSRLLYVMMRHKTSISPVGLCGLNSIQAGADLSQKQNFKTSFKFILT